MKIMVFLHGTAIMHRNAVGRTREERVRQVREGRDESLFDFAAYVPVGSAVRKLQTWSQQGAQIVYLSSHQSGEAVKLDEAVLRSHGFPDGPVFYRQQGQAYPAVAERVLPDVLIEDDCESIGGEAEMTYPQLPPALKAKIRSIVVKEFGGIDHLPDEVAALKDTDAVLR
jgi:hypothetical protein